MTIKNGKVEKYMTGSGYYERYRYDVITKNEGNYTETLIAQCLYESGTVTDNVETPMQVMDELTEYKIYPNMTVENAITKHGINGYTWHTALAEV